jgi:hypothetical protein
MANRQLENLAAEILDEEDYINQHNDASIELAYGLRKIGRKLASDYAEAIDVADSRASQTDLANEIVRQLANLYIADLAIVAEESR